MRLESPFAGLFVFLRGVYNRCTFTGELYVYNR